MAPAAIPEKVNPWSITALYERPVKIGAKIVRHVRSISFQMAEVMVSRGLFRQILDAIAALRPLPAVRC
jgi:hypothetical protein